MPYNLEAEQSVLGSILIDPNCFADLTEIIHADDFYLDEHGEIFYAMQDLQELEELGNTVKNNSLCALGQTAANPIMSTLTHFRDEYIAHIVDKTCPAKVCKNLMCYTIEQDNCVGCGRCAKACPADAIEKTDYIAPGKKLASYQIDAGKCVKCGACMATCKPNAIVKK